MAIKSELEKIRDWTMILLSFQIIARASELCEYCPIVEHVSLPSEVSEWDEDNMPKYIQIGLMDWKHRRLEEKGSPLMFYIHRNRLNTQYCPVYNLLYWLTVSEISIGPIFTKIKDGLPLVADHVIEIKKPNNKVVAKWVTASNVAVNVSYAEWSDVIHDLFVAMAEGTGTERYKAITSHSFRRTAVMWANRCGASQSQIRMAGRWTSCSASFQEYIKEGAMEAERKYPNSFEDPIRKMWVFHPVVMNNNVDN